MSIIIQNDQEKDSVIRHYLKMSMNEMRHLEIGNIIQSHNISSLVDFGCCEGLLIKKLSRSAKIKLLVGVDIEETAISSAVHNAYPQPVQFTIQYHRQEDQQVIIYRGDVTKKYQKLRELDVELVTLVELIEHLVPEDIPMAMDNVFGFIKPKFCFISTPNKEFNDYFDFQVGQMRHWDHKFEWTRAEFKAFCDSVQEQYGYTYTIGGIGEHVTQTSKGQCSQYALFSRPEQLVTKDRNCHTVEDDIQLEEMAYYLNKSWRNNVEKLMRESLFKSLFGKESISFDDAIPFLQKETIGERLIQNGKPITKELIIASLQQNSNEFEWNDQMYLRRKTYESSIEEQQPTSQWYDQDFDFEQSFADSFENDLSVSTTPVRRGNRDFIE